MNCTSVARCEDATRCAECATFVYSQILQNFAFQSFLPKQHIHFYCTEIFLLFTLEGILFCTGSCSNSKLSAKERDINAQPFKILSARLSDTLMSMVMRNKPWLSVVTHMFTANLHSDGFTYPTHQCNTLPYEQSYSPSCYTLECVCVFDCYVPCASFCSTHNYHIYYVHFGVFCIKG